MPSKKIVLKAYLAPGEYEQIMESAGKSGLTLSAFTRRVCLGQQVPSIENQQVRRELLRINADLGRLGGLFKLCLSEKDRPLVALHQEVRRVLWEIEARQRELKAAVASI